MLSSRSEESCGDPEAEALIMTWGKEKGFVEAGVLSWDLKGEDEKGREQEKRLKAEEKDCSEV